MVFAKSSRISNPLWAYTRSEALTLLSVAGVVNLLQETISCAHTRGRSLVKPHCGICSQCIDRRFGSLAAGLEEHDIVERYERDIFLDALPEGNPRTLAESYVRFALKVLGTSEEELFNVFPQLYDCILSNDNQPQEAARIFAGLLKRHASTVIGVLEDQVAKRRKELVASTLPKTCLVRLTASGQHSEDHRKPVINSLAGGLRKCRWRMGRDSSIAN